MCVRVYVYDYIMYVCMYVCVCMFVCICVCACVRGYLTCTFIVLVKCMNRLQGHFSTWYALSVKALLKV